MSELRHVPASHPVLHRMRAPQQDPRLMRGHEAVADGLDAIALAVAAMPSVPLSIPERQMAQLIVDELLRRIAR